MEAAGATVLQVETLFDQGGGQMIVAAGYSYQNLLTITNHQPTPDTSGAPAPDAFRITPTPELDTEHRIQYWIDYPDGSGGAVWLDLDEHEPPNDPDVRARARALELVQQHGQSRTPRADAS